VPFPGLNAALLIATEFGGGLALLAGAGTRVAAGLLTFAMTVAIATVHLANGFFAPTGIEFPLTLALASLATVFTGAGRYSVDALLSGRGEGARHGATREDGWKFAA
jgi:putative oxidoreductase